MAPELVFQCDKCTCFVHVECTISKFICVECDVNLHLQCIPIPSSIKHNDHIHPIILTNSIMKDDLLKNYLTHSINENDDLVEYYCDVRETQGNPKHHVYCCKACLYVANVECIISETRIRTLINPGGVVRVENQSLEAECSFAVRTATTLTFMFHVPSPCNFF
ncbi:hypothetical protein Dsin_024192 [Dipteronia sinensis]|uniref:DC1 domain-containing protein n=1 Tax=Dipteronia sinensis TaxID=43782 RepID=A0AAE0A5I5_9ROSI|nr:hypothetical protein Dsin_024192 [Dipteronia sinensis]